LIGCFVSEKTLVLNDVKPEDTGTYICRASNQNGYTEKEYDVTIRCNITTN